ncbi:hypothetical protein [Bradyrhizobium sp. 18]|uniref:hypothetical protein n=1 Tax=Bradyrhizobium sp. 18 TaxID=2782657 RepID=UPI001FFB3140|nr:hypothetical protein [Bradyrhizobium sp. 18]MCK1506879.1 hypothetical protein [Bradyrhizobium sp. 18]
MAPSIGYGNTRRRGLCAITREEVCRFACGCIKGGWPEPAAVAFICFEWLQRPEIVVTSPFEVAGLSQLFHGGNVARLCDQLNMRKLIVSCVRRYGGADFEFATDFDVQSNIGRRNAAR